MRRESVTPIVRHLGGNILDTKGLNNFLDGIGKRLCNHKTLLAKLHSIWAPSLSDENAVRMASPVLMKHISLSFLIYSSCNEYNELVSTGLSAMIIDYNNYSEVIAIVTGSLDQYKSCVIHLLSREVSNLLGETLLVQLDSVGYSGIFSDYKRTRRNNQLLLEYKPC